MEEDSVDNEEDDHVGDDDDNDVQWTSTAAPSTRVITRESLLVAQREDLRRVMELIDLTEQHARTLLIYHRWDVEKVFAVFVDRGKDKLFEEAGITVKINQAPGTAPAAAMTCEVCMEEAQKATTMDCGHNFCDDCWTEHFIVKINEGQSRRITCMAYKCTAICDEAIVRNLVSERDANLAEHFERFLLESYIEDNGRVKWCPSVPHCGNAIRVEDEKFCEVECICGEQFCFGCSSEAHSPCSCLMWELWVKKCRDESENVSWITKNTVSCPKCHKNIQKNEGCNLVVCKCGQPFCWLCGGATGTNHTWKSIEGHSCGRFKEDPKVQAERAKRDMYRFVHYHNRYKAHTASFELESKLKVTIQSQISTLENRESDIKDFSWLTSGLGRLLRSRQVLSYSYAFAFYMFGEDLFGDEMTPAEREIKKNLFEDQQQQLEINVERLSKVIERLSKVLERLLLEERYDEPDGDDPQQLRMQLITLTVTTDTLSKSMYEVIENDLLGKLQFSTHRIAAYKSKGVEKASQLLLLMGRPIPA
ncbi:hypothetical protein MKW94_027167 [Papaver nudicaule]|uniref:RBR-type E3 ubiquitin transferase n=1 Tax=Papaver nudicaule TaxID=74823 RepID=A0AA41S9G7_PAPNU|nr:hypothetical protein [Papaver nudicaule]